MVEFYAVIPTYNRPMELEALLYSLQVNGVDRFNTLIINNGDPLDSWFYRHAIVVEDDNRDPHIYEQWNWGLAWAAHKHGRRVAHHVAILNDDVELPADFMIRMQDVLMKSSATIAFPNQHGATKPFHRSGYGKVDTLQRLTGYAFVVNGHHGIRCDERFKWWYGDDDLDRQARERYLGTYLVHDVTVTHKHPDESTNSSPERQRQAGLDRQTFIDKYGAPPW